MSIVTATTGAIGIWACALAVYKYPTSAGLSVYAWFIGLAIGYAAWLINLSLLRLFTDNIEEKNFQKVASWLLLLILLMAHAWVATYTAAKRKMQVLEEQYATISDAATLHREAELFKLRQQLQPHFLYNSLNSIGALILIAPEQAQEMIGKLSEFLRSSVKREGQEFISLSEELSYVASYLAIESVRFGDRLQVHFERLFNTDAAIPPFLLQPLLENAIKFGLYGTNGSVDIYVSITMNDGILKIEIKNPFDVAQQPPAGTGFGLQGIRRRLYLLFARADLLETTRNDGIFITTLYIPQQDE